MFKKTLIDTRFADMYTIFALIQTRNHKHV